MASEEAIEHLRGEKYAAADPGAARRLLLDSTTTAVALLPACKQIIGDFLSWEPESIWRELEHHKIELPEENRVKLQAAITLHLVPSFYWDGIVFENTVHAFDNEIPNPEALEEAPVTAVAWAVKEAAWVRQWLGDPPLKFEHESVAYTAIVLEREGFLVAPEQLAFAQDLLEKRNRNHTELVETVREQWQALDKSKLNSHIFRETPEGVQLARLAMVELHIQDREKTTEKDLEALA